MDSGILGTQAVCMLWRLAKDCPWTPDRILALADGTVAVRFKGKKMGRVVDLYISPAGEVTEVRRRFDNIEKSEAFDKFTAEAFKSFADWAS